MTMNPNVRSHRRIARYQRKKVDGRCCILRPHNSALVWQFVIIAKCALESLSKWLAGCSLKMIEAEERRGAAYIELMPIMVVFR
jgi:hypothetical protein